MDEASSVNKIEDGKIVKIIVLTIQAIFFMFNNIHYDRLKWHFYVPMTIKMHILIS